jgi:hypothetical protein
LRAVVLFHQGRPGIVGRILERPHNQATGTAAKARRQPQEGMGLRKKVQLRKRKQTLEGRNPKDGTGMKQGRQPVGG